MALGIDIYRYQTVTDWQAVKRHGVQFVYVKATDGGGRAIARADGQVRGAQGVGLPVGLYHYAQLAPSPEDQADVLTGEVRRLGAADLPPVLDLEDPWRPGQAARDFARRFLLRLRVNGFTTVCLYANTSMLRGIGADDFNVPGVVIWEANYGANTGRRNPLGARPWRTAIHQYTSNGVVPGITGRADLNESLTDLTGADDMALTQDDVNRIAAAVWEQQRPQLDKPETLLPMWMWTVGGNMGAWAAAQKPIPGVDTGQVVAGLRDALVPAITAALAEQAGKVDRVSELDDEEIADAVARRLFQGPQPVGPESEEGSNG